jgi:hypothetical protein
MKPQQLANVGLVVDDEDRRLDAAGRAFLRLFPG